MANVLCGIDNISDFLHLFEGKRLGLLTNPTGVNNKFESTINILHKQFNLTVLFSPEHGIRGNIQAGVCVENYTDDITNLPVISLYGKNHNSSLTNEMLNLFDVFVYDIQDVGSRFYTYLSKLKQVMEICGRAGKEVVVFDRPNPIGNKVEGGWVEEEMISVIGCHNMPQRYGLTIGELAQLFNKSSKMPCNLHVVPMKNYLPDLFWHETGLHYINASPNLPSMDGIVLYNGICIFEGTTISEGRGTTRPFEQIGSPEIDAYKLADIMNGYGLNGVCFRPVYFTPSFSKHKDTLCKGVQIHVLDRKVLEPVKLGLTLFVEALKMSAISDDFFVRYSERFTLDLLTGSSLIRTKNVDLDVVEVLKAYLDNARKFNDICKDITLY